jgi:hypothetical protein
MVRRIFHSPGLASCRCRPLSSNVRPHKLQSPQITAPLVRLLERRLLPSLHDLTREVPNWNRSTAAVVFSNSLGARTDYQGWGIGVSCFSEEPDEGNQEQVSLMVSLCHLHRQARINADVAWTSGFVEVEYSAARSNEDWPLASVTEVEAVLAYLPALIKALRSAVERGHAPSAA